MRKVFLANAVKKLHLRYWKNNIKDELQRVAGTVNHDLGTYLQYCSKHWRILAVGSVSCLRKFQKELTSWVNPDVMETLETQEYRDQTGRMRKVIDLFGYDSFGKKTLTKKEIDDSLITAHQTSLSEKELSHIPWTPYLFVFMLPIQTCPYCNRQYITPFVQDKTATSSEKRMRADLDHFWPKNKYPHFSMSLYNLVPSCKFCNSSLKGKRDFSFEAPSPYECNYDDYFQFETDFGNLTFPSISIKTNVIDERIKPILDMFAIEEIYKYHSNIAQEFVQKRICYPDELLEKILQAFSVDNYYGSIDKLRAVLLGFPESTEQIGDEVLGKLKYDLACEMGFVHPANR